jgi:hypothetical protein
MSWSWDSRGARERFAAAIPAYIEDGLAGSPTASGAWQVEGGAVALATAGNRATLVFAPDAETARAAADGELRAGT